MPYSCTHCGHQSTKSSNLKRHLLVHTGERPFKCDQCTQSFTLKLTLKNHTQAKHSELPKKLKDKKFFCEFCDFVCDIKNGKRHLRSKHKDDTLAKENTQTKEKPSCAHCGKNFFDSSNLKRHIYRLHTVKVQYSNESTFKILDTPRIKKKHVRFAPGTDLTISRDYSVVYNCTLCIGSSRPFKVIQKQPTIKLCRC